MNNANWKKPFYVIWTGQSVSLIGSSLVQFAIIWWLAETADSATVMSISALVGIVPTVALAPFVGTLVDRWRRRLILIISDVSIALFTFVLIVLFMLIRGAITRKIRLELLRLLRAAGQEDAFYPQDKKSPPGFNEPVGGYRTCRGGGWQGLCIHPQA